MMENTEQQGDWQPSIPLIVGNPALTQWILTSEDILSFLEHDLRGEIYVINEEKGTASWEKKGMRLINDEGIVCLKSILHSFINKTVFLSTLSEDDIREICGNIELCLNNLFFLKYKEFDIDKAYLDIIKHKIIYIIFMALRHAQNSGMRETLTKTIQVREMTSSTPQTQKQGLFGSLFHRKD